MRPVLSICLAVLALALPAAPAIAQQAPEAAAARPVTTEAYYRIRWGSEGEFIALFEKNHLPILQEAKARGLVHDIRIDLPYTHMVGGPRWDFRVATTYRDASSALLTDPRWQAVFDETVAKLKKANPKFDEEEQRRFALLDEHWDVVLVSQ